VSGGLLIRGGRLGSRQVDLRIRRGRIVAIAPRLAPAPWGEGIITLDGEWLLPGLVNAHDHLHLDVCPRSGHPPYANAHAWARDVDEGRGFALERHLAISIGDRARWGGLRNLLSGVTWVGHHDARYAVLDAPDFPVRVAPNYAQINSVQHGDPGRGVRRAGRRGVFFVHVAEGIDDQSRSEFATLERRGGLTASTVIIHGTALTDDDRRRANDVGAALVVCTSSNQFLFDATPSIAGIDGWTLGTDSTLTGSAHLLDELRLAHAALGVSPAQLTNAVTRRAAAILRLPLGAGTLEVGAPACVVALRAESLLAATPRDLALGVNGGVRVAHPDLAPQMAFESLTGTVHVEGERRLVSPADAAVVARVGRAVSNPAPGWFGTAN
jgi:cytosine/adenosine deaminase-related metal-dependent hydrolase